MTQDALAEATGTYKSKISKLENGELRLTDVWMRKIAKALDCKAADLLEEAGTILPEASAMHNIPVIGEVPGGDLLLAVQHPAESFIPYSGAKPGLFALRVIGNSMSRIAPHGAYVVVDSSQKDPSLLAGQPVIVQIHNGYEWECTFKIYKTNPLRFEPHSIEPGHDTVFPRDRHWSLFGRVIGSYGIVGDGAELIERA